MVHSSITSLPPLRSRWVLSALLVVVALVCVVMWGLLTLWATDATGKAFARADLPGELTTDLHPGVWKVYAEGPAAVDRVTVAYPDGRPVEVDRVDGAGSAYDRGGFTAIPVATFELPLGGEWPDMEISVTGSAEDPDTTFAVGAADELTPMDQQRWGMLALLVVNVGAALAIGVVPLVRRRRQVAEGDRD